MDVKEFIKKRKSEFEKAIEFYQSDIASIRTGRATPSLVENIKVDYYGTISSIRELASIGVPEPRTVVIQPWDKNAIQAIEGAIRNSDVGIQPVTDNNIIRLSVPALTEERRKEFIKVLKQKTEDTRIKIRKIREDIWSDIKKMEANHELSEDSKFRGKEELQNMVKEFNDRVEIIESQKEKELLS